MYTKGNTCKDSNRRTCVGIVLIMYPQTERQSVANNDDGYLNKTKKNIVPKQQSPVHVS